MKYYLNDTSIQNQFNEDFEKLINFLYELAKLRIEYKKEIGKLHVAETLKKKKVKDNQELIKSVTTYSGKGKSQLKKELILEWISTSVDRDIYSIGVKEKFYLNKVDLGKNCPLFSF